MAFGPGFNLAEALDLVALSAIVEGGGAPPQPTGWNIIFDSLVNGQFTEKWQLWENASGSYARRSYLQDGCRGAAKSARPAVACRAL